MKSKFILALFLSFFSFNGSANDSNGHKQAIKDTQATLKDRSKVKEITKSDSKANEVDKHVVELAGSEDNAKEMYAISADVLPVLMEMNQDNPEKALESLATYSKDPGAFLKSLPANIREKIEKLSKKIEAQKGKPASKP